MHPPRLLAGIGLGALILSLIALLPARVAFTLLGLPANAATGLSGTAWQGTAQRLSLESLALGPIRWQVKPSRLLLGKLAADVEATLPDGFLNAAVALTLGGNVAVSDLEAAAPLAWLAPAAGSASGQLTARFERLTMSSGRVVTAIGGLQVAGVVLPVPTAGGALAPGTYTVTFDADDLAADDPLTAALKDAGGPLEIAGVIKFTPPRSYELTGSAKPRPDAPPELRNTLQMLGPATPDGSHALSLAGSF